MKKMLLFVGLFVMALIQNASAQFLIFTPNGGETLTEGQAYEIRWAKVSSDPTSQVYLYYKHNGENKSIGSVDATLGSYTWTVPPGLGGTTGRIHLSTGYTYTSDSSDADFSIQKAVTVVSPNGGESLKEGQTFAISWNRKNPAISKVSLWLADSNGRSLIANDIDAFSPSYYWKVPYALSKDSYKIWITGTTSTGIEYHDQSDNSFSIQHTPELELTSPAGGEKWIQERYYTIQWKTEPSVTGDVGIWLISPEHNPNYMRYIGGTKASNGSYTWRVSSIADWDQFPDSGRIVLNTSGSIGSLSDTSGYVQIRRGLKLLYPNGGQTLAQGSTYNITWQVNDTTSKVSLSYLYNGLYHTIANNVNAAQQSYAWTVPYSLSQAGQIVISSSALDGYYIKDSSDAKVYIQPTTHIKVRNPNGGENFVVGDQMFIGWEAYNTENVNVELTLNGGATWQTLGTFKANGANGGMSIPTTQIGTGTQGKIRISATLNTSLRDESDGYFSVQPRTIQVLKPTYGEKLTPGASYTIVWQANATNTYKLSYSTDGGTSWKVIHAGPYSGTSYTWTVPADYSTNCRIKVATYSGASAEGISQSFSILSNAFKVLTPAAGQYWGERGAATVKWSDPVPNATYNIHFNEGWSSVWRLLKSGVPGGTSGLYSTTVTTPSFGCDFTTYTARVRVTRVSDGVMVYSGEFEAEDGNDHDCDYSEFRMGAAGQAQETKADTVVMAQTEGLRLYPNPAKEVITLSLNGLAVESKTAVLTVYNTAGKLVLQKQVPVFKGAVQSKLDVSTLQQGAYILSVTGIGSKTQSISFIKQ